MSAQKVITFATLKFISRHKAIFGRPPSREGVKKIKKQLLEGAASHEENRLLYSISKTGRVEFFVFTNVVFLGEYDKKFLIFPMLYCSHDRKIRREFYKAIQNRAAELAVRNEVKDVAIWCHFDDAISAKFFKSMGKLNMIELVGDVAETLRSMKSGAAHKTRKLRSTDLRVTSKIELLAHKQDSSSRMHQTTGKKNALKKYASFHKTLVKKANAFVSLENKKITGIGAVFLSKKNKVASIATIAVHPRFSGRGISKSLYREMLGSLKKAGIQKYVGHSSTGAVLGMAKQMKRVEFCRAYSMPIKKLVSAREGKGI